MSSRSLVRSGGCTSGRSAWTTLALVGAGFVGAGFSAAWATWSRQPDAAPAGTAGSALRTAAATTAATKRNVLDILTFRDPGADVRNIPAPPCEPVLKQSERRASPQAIASVDVGGAPSIAG